MRHAEERLRQAQIDIEELVGQVVALEGERDYLERELDEADDVIHEMWSAFAAAAPLEAGAFAEDNDKLRRNL